MRQAVRVVILIALAALALPYLLAPLYRAGHPVSALMAWRKLTGAPVSRQWIDFAAISPSLPRSVVGSEDSRFCSHHGIDWNALQDAIDDAEDGEPSGGGSTITQQVTKNLFLWPGRSVIRKGLEIPLAMWVDFVLPKQRILEIYLNIRSSAAPAIPAPGCAGWPGPIWPGRNRPDCSIAGMKIGHFEPILALDHPGFHVLTRFLHREPVSTHGSSPRACFA